jgi:alpha-methylacyl-CoA racemase
MQPLSDLTILDFTTLLPGPMASLFLAEAGANVIKIERAEGEDMRFYPPDGIPFALLNRGKKSLIADLKNADDIVRILALVKTADILIEQFRPGVMARLGLDYATLQKLNPRLIYCSISGYGQTGAKAFEAGHDLNYIASTGLLSLAPNGVPPGLIADIAGGTMPAVMNILLALLNRAKTGEGAYLDIAMTDAMFAFAWMGLSKIHSGGGTPKGNDLVLTGGSARYQLYPTLDGKQVACAALEQKFWEAFCLVLGVPTSTTDITLVAGIIAQKPTSYWEPLFHKADCCVTIMKTLDEALHDPHFVERGLFAWKTDDKGVFRPALPVPISPQFRSEGVAKVEMLGG